MCGTTLAPPDVGGFPMAMPALAGAAAASPATSARITTALLRLMLNMVSPFAGFGVDLDDPRVAEQVGCMRCPLAGSPFADIDVASFAVVRVIRDDFADPASRYRWLPKRAFHAIAERYARP